MCYKSLVSQLFYRNYRAVRKSMRRRDNKHQFITHHLYITERLVIWSKRDAPELDLACRDLLWYAARYAAVHLDLYRRIKFVKLLDDGQQVKHSVLVGADSN